MLLIGTPTRRIMATVGSVETLRTDVVDEIKDLRELITGNARAEEMETKYAKIDQFEGSASLKFIKMDQ